MYLFLGSQERVRNSHGKRAISVRAIEVLLYYPFDFFHNIFLSSDLASHVSRVVLEERLGKKEANCQTV